MKKLLCFCLAFCLSSFILHAQWVAQNSNAPANFYIQFLDAVDNNVCWGLVSDPANQLTPVQQFNRTINGGNTWTLGNINNATGLSPSSICAINKDTAWVAMFSGTGGAGRILRTNDGGVTWTHQSTALFNASGNFPNWVYFWDKNNGVCQGDPTGGYFEIYTTTDGGTNWVRTPQVNIPAPQANEYGITDVFTTYGDSTVFWGSSTGRVFKSSDRGLTWTAANTPFTGYYIGALAFADADHGLATLGSVAAINDVAVTVDGGNTWTFAGSNTGGFTTILGLSTIPGLTQGYFLSNPAAGSLNGTSYSPNGGLNWIAVDNLIHSDIDFVNDSTGWTGSNEFLAPMYKWSTPIQIAQNDVASQSIDVAINTGLFTTNPKSTFINYGLNTQTFNVTMNISGGYSSTKTITNLGFYGTQQVSFDPWTPAATGPYTITIYTSLATDTDHSNDTLQKNVMVYDAFENYGWISKPNVPAATFGLAGAFNLQGNTASSPGTIYSVGGADFTLVQQTTNTFSTQTNIWSLTNPMPTGKYQFSAHTVNGKVYCIGGYSGGFTPDPNSYVYDIATGLWSNAAPMPTPVGDYASGVYKDSLIYYIAGYSGLDQNIVQIYNTYTNSWSNGTAKPGLAVAGLRGDINGNKIVIAGGFNQNLGAPVADAYMGTINPANPASITWTAIAPYPIGPVSRLAAGTVFRSLRPLVIFAGGDPTGMGVQALNDCWGYDLSLNQWLVGAAKITQMSNISNLIGLVANDSLWMASVSGYNGSALSTVHEWLSLGASPPLSVNEYNLPAETVSIFPNPSSGDVYVVSDGMRLSGFILTDLAGKTIRELRTETAGNKFLLNISDLNAGVYFIRILNEQNRVSSVKKLIKP